MEKTTPQRACPHDEKIQPESGMRCGARVPVSYLDDTHGKEMEDVVQVRDVFKHGQVAEVVLQPANLCLENGYNEERELADY